MKLESSKALKALSDGESSRVVIGYWDLFGEDIKPFERFCQEILEYRNGSVTI